MNPFLKKNLIYLLMLILCTYAIFTAVSWILFDLNWENSSAVGSAISGLSLPFVNLIGAYLIFLSFEEQRNSNNLQEKGIQSQKENTQMAHYIEVYNNLKRELKDDNSEIDIHTALLEFEILIIAVQININESNKLKEFLFTLFQVKLDSLLQHSNGANKSRCLFLKNLISHGSISI